MLDLVVLAVLALAAWLGWRRGTLRVALPLAGIAAGYVAAALLYRPLGHAIAQAAHLQPIIAYPLGGLAAFLLANLLVRIPARRTERRLAQEQATGTRILTPMDRGGGALLGVSIAAALGVVVVWAVAGLRFAGGQAPAADASYSGRLAAGASRRVVRAAAERLTGERLLSSTMALLASDPAGGSRAVQTIVGDVRLQALFEDSDLHTALVSRDEGAVAAHATIRSLAQDPAFAEAIGRLGLVRGEAGADAIARVMVADVAPLVRAVDELRRDPEVLRMMEGENGLTAKLQGGDARALLNDPDFNRLATRILETLRRQGATAR